MDSCRVIIIDDERLAREELKWHLGRYPLLQLVAEAANADEGAAAIQQWQPDLIFLDVQMPERSGFEMLESLSTVPPVIFTTAYHQYAVQAFEISALDYLVKPIREERFAKAVEKIMQFREQALAKQQSAVDHFFIREGERFYLIPTKEIHLIESAGNYARIYSGNKKPYLKRSLNQLEQTLDASHFFRVNRNTIINTAYIQQIDALPDGRLQIRLQTGEALTVSSRQSAVFKNRNRH